MDEHISLYHTQTHSITVNIMCLNDFIIKRINTYHFFLLIADIFVVVVVVVVVFCFLFCFFFLTYQGLV